MTVAWSKLLIVVVSFVALGGWGCSDFGEERCYGGCGPCGVGTWDCETDTCSFEMPYISERPICGGDGATIVFVDPQVGVSGDGSVNRPLSSLHEALAKNPQAILIVGSSTLVWEKPWPGNVSLVGGFARNPNGFLAYEPSNRPLLRGWADAQGDAFGLLIDGNGAQTALSNLNIQAPPSARHSYGLLAVDADLTLDHVNVFASDAVPGQNGQQGAQGSQGQAGKSSANSSPGQPGVQTTCPSSAGGAGGQGQIRSAQNNRSATSGQSSVLQTLGGAPGQPGQMGASGAQGQNGMNAKRGSIISERWMWGGGATEGEPGEPGAGGGGGGGGLISQDGEALGGSGGGSGGCGGQGGGAATSGGSSFGVMLVTSSMVALNSDFTAGQAGLGGQGGLGGVGGEGGQGGPQTASGGTGGRGGQGGQGGQGGDGVGGGSIALYCHRSNVQMTNVLLNYEAAQPVEQSLDRSTDGRASINCGE